MSEKRLGGEAHEHLFCEKVVGGSKFWRKWRGVLVMPLHDGVSKPPTVLTTQLMSAPTLILFGFTFGQMVSVRARGRAFELPSARTIESSTSKFFRPGPRKPWKNRNRGTRMFLCQPALTHSPSEGSQARSKATDSRSVLAGVPRFKSGPSHIL